MGDIIERLSDFKICGRTIDDAIIAITDLRNELRVTNELLNSRMKVMAAIPECELHGSNCVRHAIEWINDAKKVMLIRKDCGLMESILDRWMDE